MLPDKDVEMDIDNDLSILQLKELYIEHIKKNDSDKADAMTASALRFLCLGKELKDDLFVYSYDLTDELTIQCMQRRSA